MRGIYSIDPSDQEYKDIIKNVRRKSETPNADAMPRKRAFSKAWKPSFQKQSQGI